MLAPVNLPRAELHRPPRRAQRIKLFFPLCLALLLSPAHRAWPEAAPAPVSTVLSIQGTVEVSSGAAGPWAPARVGQALQVRDRIRAGAESRAMIRLTDLSLFRLNAGALLEITPPPPGGTKPGLDLKNGAGYFFGRDRPGDIQLRTPSAAGAVRGTEFHLEVAPDGRTVIAMIDGEAELANEHGAIVLTSGEQGEAAANHAPEKTALLNAINIIQWCLYYPAVLLLDELPITPEARTALAESLSAYANGDLPAALAAYPSGREPRTDAERIYRAALLLTTGDVAGAEGFLGELQEDAESAETVTRLAGAVRLLIASVKFEARDSAGGPAAAFASESLAESYYHQSRSDLVAARAAARRATAQQPGSGFAWARLAEMEFSFGRTPEALAAVERAMELAPRHGQAAALNGFLLAARNRPHAALAEMERAVALDGALGNAWLGRGLLKIRLGDPVAGREDLQAAATLEPQRAALRSYLGKAHFHEGNAPLAEKELALAQRFDPNDPTAWLYSSLLRFQQNRINDAVQDLEHSKRLNQNRSVFRSRLLLDQDQAVRGANLAAIYRDAGMIETSLREASRAVQNDYGNFAAHAFLSSSYNAFRDPRLVNLRYETPWFSEHLLASLLAPVGAGSLSQSLSQQEYSRLFEGDGPRLFSETEYWSNGRWSQTGSLHGSEGRVAYAFDAYYLSDPGFRPNSEIEARMLSLQTKIQVTPQDSLYFRASHWDVVTGDVNQYYDQASARPGLQTRERQEPNLLAGYHREWRPGVHTLFLAARFDSRQEFADPRQPVLMLGRDGQGRVIAVPAGSLPSAGTAYRSDLHVYSAELQQIWQQERHGLIVGGRYQAGRVDVRNEMGASTTASLRTSMGVIPLTFASGALSQREDAGMERAGAYAYHHWRIWEPLQVTAGISYDHLRHPANHNAPPVSEREQTRDLLAPKAGFVWNIDDNSALRFAYTRSLGGFSLDQSVRLEPAQVAGFLQAYRSLTPESVEGSPPAARFETFGALLDRRFGTGTYAGIELELLQSDVERSLGTMDLTFTFPPPPAGFRPGPSATPLKLDYRERTLLFNINQLVGKHWTLGARYRLSAAEFNTRFPEIPETLLPATRNEATLHQLRLYGAYHHRCGFFALAEGLWNRQSNRGYSPAISGDDFWHLNLHAGYRFARRQAEARVGLLNVTGRDYRLNPLNLHNDLPRERTLAVSLKLQF